MLLRQLCDSPQIAACRMLHELMLKLRQLQKHVEGHEICKATFRSTRVAATSQMLSYRCSYRYKYWDTQIHFIAHPLCSAFVWELSVDFSTFSGMFLSFICLSLRLFLLLPISAFFFLPFSSLSISNISYYCLCLVLLKQSLQFCRLQWLLLCRCCCCFVFVAVCCCHCPCCTLPPSAYSTWMKFPATALNNHNNRYFFMQLFAFCLLSAF